ncbi:hypothetical protein [Burkholderia cenocepacia]|uniref:hypothetical protein n=1 Tax=Burkholderia cenocepacia TaxID=95486 RepID=UPI00222F5E9E|nr:hypothetical protein [Burkholderia cenocepacia]MCW3539309.1 hypothetical protein [Burkholderia cenocepacia]
MAEITSAQIDQLRVQIESALDGLQGIFAVTEAQNSVGSFTAPELAWIIGNITERVGMRLEFIHYALCKTVVGAFAMPVEGFPDAAGQEVNRG